MRFHFKNILRHRRLNRIYAFAERLMVKYIKYQTFSVKDGGLDMVWYRVGPFTFGLTVSPRSNLIWDIGESYENRPEKLKS